MHGLPVLIRCIYSYGMRSTLPLLVCLCACTPFPQLDGTISDAARNAPYPELTPILAQPDIGNASTVEADMAARIAALQARAERLRQFDIGALQ